MTRCTRIDGGFGFPLGFAAAVAATAVSICAGATRHHGYSLGMLVVVVAVVAAVTTARAAMGTAAVAWALHAGFVLGRLGQLVFTPESAHAALALVAVALISSILANTLLHAPTTRPATKVTTAKRLRQLSLGSASRVQVDASVFGGAGPGLDRPVRFLRAARRRLGATSPKRSIAGAS